MCSFHRTTRLAALLSVLSIVYSSPLGAQSGWSFRVVAETGVFYSVRDLGKNIGEDPELVVYQVASRMDAAPLVAGGVEAWSEGRSVGLRVMGSTTLGQTASGRVAVCAVLTGEACEPRSVDARLNALSADLIFVQRAAGSRIRPEILLGAGLRAYRFTATTCPAEPVPLLEEICELVTGIYENQSQVQPFVEFGLGVRARFGRVTGFVRAQDLVGPYNGGGRNAEGEIQNDVVAVVGASFTVR